MTKTLGESPTLGQLLRHWRGKENQTDFARRAGVAQSDISKYERDLKEPEPATLRKLARAAGQPIDVVIPFVFPEFRAAHTAPAHGQPIGHPGQDMAEAKKSAHRRTSRRGVVVNQAAPAHDAGPALGGALNATQRKKRTATHPHEPLPPDDEIINTFETFGELLDRIVAAFVAGEIRSHRTPEPDSTDALDAGRQSHPREAGRKKGRGAR